MRSTHIGEVSFDSCNIIIYTTEHTYDEVIAFPSFSYILRTMDTTQGGMHRGQLGPRNGRMLK